MTRNTLTLIAFCLMAPAAAVAQTGGLTKVQLYALQQQLKEECGLEHSTGVMDGPTRHAIAVCNKKYGTQGSGVALLAAMNIGFSTGDNPPAGMGSVMGNNTTTVTTTDSSMTTVTKTHGTARSRKKVRTVRDSTEETSETPAQEHAEKKGAMKTGTKTAKKTTTTTAPAKKY